MIFLLFSTYSSGSTLFQQEISRYLEVPKPSGIDIVSTEFGLLDWAAHFAYAPMETIDFEPCRTYSPNLSQEVPEWRNNYRSYLNHSAHLINRDYRNPITDNWITVEDFFVQHIVPTYDDFLNLPLYRPGKDRLEYVINLFQRIGEHSRVFGKNPKWLNDFSGHTVQLIHELNKAGVPITGILLTRCPADTFTSILERKLRLDEMFNGDNDKYANFIADSLDFSTRTGQSLSKKYNFFEIKYETMASDFSSFLNYVGIKQTHKLNFSKKYSRRYVLNPRGRAYAPRLKQLGELNGYKHYPNRITVFTYLKELFTVIVRLSHPDNSNVNNPETIGTILKRCFWMEMDTSKARRLKNIVRSIIREHKTY